MAEGCCGVRRDRRNSHFSVQSSCCGDWYHYQHHVWRNGRCARALVPDLKRIAIVGDLLDNLPAYRHFKEEIPTVAHGLDLIDLTGLTMEDLRSRVAVLPGQTAIIYTTINLDRAGVSYVPAEALSLVAEVANRPIVISTETFLGRGAVGGFLVTPRGSWPGRSTVGLAYSQRRRRFEDRRQRQQCQQTDIRLASIAAMEHQRVGLTSGE